MALSPEDNQAPRINHGGASGRWSGQPVETSWTQCRTKQRCRPGWKKPNTRTPGGKVLHLLPGHKGELRFHPLRFTPPAKAMPVCENHPVVLKVTARYIRRMADYSEYQKKVIRRFYENRESGDEQRLAELVTNLYLSEGKKREKLWTQAEETMLRLKVPKKRVEHLIRTKDPGLIAEVVKELEAGTLKRESPPAKTD